MELIERYLQAVKSGLPSKQSDDIVQELRDSILSQVEERESTLGRPLGESEIMDILKRMGSPMVLAGRYGGRRHVIAGSLFTIYWKVLSFALSIALVAHAATSIALAASGKPLMESLAVFIRFPGVALKVFAIVTLVFGALDLLGTKLRPCDHWDPSQLPPLTKKPARKSKFDLVAQLIMKTVFSAWWLTGLHYQYLVFGPGAAFMRFGPIWLKIYPLFVIAASVDIGITAIALMRPDLVQPGRVMRLLKHGLGLLILFLLANSSVLFVPTDLRNADWEHVVTSINFGLHIGLVVAIVATVVNFVRDTVRFVRGRFADQRSIAMGS